MTSKFQIECVDALALTYALERLTEHSYGNGVESVTLDEDAGTLEFTSSRYAMDGGGFHVGYERFIAAFQLYELKRPCIGATPYSGCYVVPDWMEVSWEPAQEEREYTMAEAIEFLDEYGEPDWRCQTEGFEKDVLELAFDHGMGEYDYTPPDDDFVHYELRYHLDQALENLPEGDFIMDELGRRWVLRFPNGSVARTYWIERYPEKEEEPGETDE